LPAVRSWETACVRKGKGEKGKEEKKKELRMDREELENLVPGVIGCMIEVHKELGPGFLESVHHRAVEVEMRYQGIPFETEKEVVLRYRGENIGVHRLDLFIAGELVVELKTVEKLSAIHYAQVRSYLKAVGKPLGLLVNFASAPVDCRRVEFDS
jgi:GxxExxY protein